MATNETTKDPITTLFDDSLTISEGRVDEAQVKVALKNAVVVMLSLFSVVGVVGNAIAFYIFFGRRSTSTSIIFILALAGTDFFTCLVTIPYTIVFELLHYDLVYDMACKTYMFLITSTVPFSAYIMVGIALDRYFCICHPFLHVFNLARAKAVILCMSVPAIIFGIITALSHGSYIHVWDVKSNYSNQLEANLTRLRFLDKSDAFIYLALNNMTSTSVVQNIAPYQMCVNNTFIFSKHFLEVYERVHALNFLLAYIAVAILYILIYKSIFTRRVKKAKRQKSNMYSSAAGKKDQQKEETQMTAINGGSQKILNNQCKKDSKPTRKITLTARNGSLAFRMSGWKKSSLSDFPVSKVRAQNKTNISNKGQETFGNGVGLKNDSVVKLQTSPATCRSKSTKENIGPQPSETDSGVYIGPQTSETVSGVYIGPQTNDAESGVYIGPQTNQAESGDCIGPQTNEAKTGVYLGHIQQNGGRDGAHVGSQSNLKDSGVYFGPQGDPENSCTYGGQQPGPRDGSCVGQNLSQEDILFCGPENSRGNNTNPDLLSDHSDGVYIRSLPGQVDNISSVVLIRPTLNLRISESATGKYEKSFKNQTTGTTINEFINSFANNSELDHRQLELQEHEDNHPHHHKTTASGSQHSPAEERPLLSKPSEGFSKCRTLQQCSSTSLTEETNLTTEETTSKNHQSKQIEGETQPNGVKRKRQCTIRDGHFIANIRTAFMLFIVTIVFIIAFLPALLMANDLIPLNLFVFYGYFIYNVVNPFIYAFMNQTFREDLKKLIHVCQP